MARSVSIVVFPGDGIGPEVTQAALEVAEVAAGIDDISLSVSQEKIGGSALDAHGVPITSKALAAAVSAQAVFLGAVGGPRWSGVEPDRRPEAGLLELRRQMGVFANLRPVTCRSALVSASSLKPHLVEGLDLMIVRELTGGIYFGEPRYTQTLVDGSRRAVDTQVYTEQEICRLCRHGFDIAASRSGRLCSVDKANVMESGRLWRQVVSSMGQDRPDVDLSHMYVDACAMELVRNPQQFDTIVTDNLFGDILSDCAAMLTGSLGMLASASLGASSRGGLFEPVHGSAPDIAGTGVANPLAMILSVAMGFRYALGSSVTADRIEGAVDAVLDSGARTADIACQGDAVVSTAQMAKLVEEALR